MNNQNQINYSNQSQNVSYGMSQTHPKYSPLLVALASLGFLDALFLSYEHFMGLIPPCTTGFQCDLVTSSSYSIIFGIPVPYLGLLYYLTLFIGALLILENKNAQKILKYLLLVSGVGFVGSLYFTYIQAFVLNAWCLYCIFSAIITTIFFATTLYINKKVQIN